MAFRAREMYRKITNKVSRDSMTIPPQIMESVMGMLPNNKLVMNRAKRGIFAGRHIQFGNKIALQGLNKSRRSWKPNVQEKRLLSYYIHDRHIRVGVTTHALRSIDKAGGIDEYLLKTPYHEMETEMGLVWKVKIERMYAELGNVNVGFFSTEEEEKIAKGFDELNLAKKEARRELRRALSETQINDLGTVRDQTPEAKQTPFVVRSTSCDVSITPKS